MTHPKQATIDGRRVFELPSNSGECRDCGCCDQRPQMDEAGRLVMVCRNCGKTKLVTRSESK